MDYTPNAPPNQPNGGSPQYQQQYPQQQYQQPRQIDAMKLFMAFSMLLGALGCGGVVADHTIFSNDAQMSNIIQQANIGDAVAASLQAKVDTLAKQNEVLLDYIGDLKKYVDLANYNSPYNRLVNELLCQHKETFDTKNGGPYDLRTLSAPELPKLNQVTNN